jgi:hypothetical protein
LFIFKESRKLVFLLVQGSLLWRSGGAEGGGKNKGDLRLWELLESERTQRSIILLGLLRLLGLERDSTQKNICNGEEA